MKVLKAIRVNDEHIYAVPAMPESTVVLSRSKSKKEQYWPTDRKELLHMLDLPELFFHWNKNTLVNRERTMHDEHSQELSEMSIQDTKRLVDVRDREIERRQKGVYFMNEGEIEYITGHNYFFLTYYNIAGTGYPEYREYQRDVFYMYDIAIKDKNILGVFIIKAKKTGLSHVTAAMILNEATTVRDKAFGVMNKTQADADDLNIHIFWRAFEELPPIMQPTFSGKNLSQIKFGSPVVKYTGTQKSIQKALEVKRNKPLNTWVYSAPTQLEVKFDGPQMHYIHLDEFPKWKESPAKMFEKIAETVKIQQTIIGKIFITSYPPEEDTDSFEEAKVIYYNSKLSTKKTDILGRTASSLICHCVNALDATHGTFDVYGRADKSLALAFNQAERLQAKTPAQKQAKIRQYGRNEEEMWRSGGMGSLFPNERLAAVKQLLEIKEREGQLLYVEGRLEWVSKRFGAVRFIPVTEDEKERGVKAPWRRYEAYADRYHNTFERDKHGKYGPDINSKFVGGCDPTSFTRLEKLTTEPSNCGIHILSFPDSVRDADMQRIASNVPVAKYLYRNENPKDDLEELIMAMFYWGCYFVVEGNKEWAVTALEEEDLHNFVLVKQGDGFIDIYKEGQKNASIHSTDALISEYCVLLSTYLSEPKLGEIDYCRQLKDIDTIDHLMQFTSGNTKKFDDIVSLGLAKIAMSVMIAIRDRLKKDKKRFTNIGRSLRNALSYR